MFNLPDRNYKSLKLDLRAYRGGGDNEEPKKPSFQNSTIRYGGTDVAKTYNDPTAGIVTEYIQTPEEKQLQEWRKSQIVEYEPKVNTWDQSTLDGFKATADANKQKNLTAFNELYEPIRRSTRNDFFNRMGTLDSTAYLDRTNEMDRTENKALSEIAMDSVSQEESLKNAELARRYQYLNYLQGSNSAMDQNAYNAMNYSNTGSNNANSFNLGNYQAQVTAYNAQQQADAARKAAMYGMIGSGLSATGDVVSSLATAKSKK